MRTYILSFSVLCLGLFFLANATDAADYLGFVTNYGDREALVIAMIQNGTIIPYDCSGENRIGPQENTVCRLFDLSGFFEGSFDLTSKTWDADLASDETDGDFTGWEYRLKPSLKDDYKHLLWWTGPDDAIIATKSKLNKDTYAHFGTDILHNCGIIGITVEPDDVHQIIRCDLTSDGTEEVIYIFDSLRREGSHSAVKQDLFSGVVLRYIDKSGDVQSEVIYLCANDKANELSLDIGGILSDRGGLWSWDDVYIQDPPNVEAYTDAYELVGIIDVDGNGDYEFVLYYMGFEWDGYDLLDFDGQKVSVVASNGWGV